MILLWENRELTNVFQCFIKVYDETDLPFFLGLWATYNPYNIYTYAIPAFYLNVFYPLNRIGLEDHELIVLQQ